MIGKIISVQHLETAGIGMYCNLRRRHEHNQSGIFVAEGNKVVLRLFESRLTLVSLLCTEEWVERCRETLEKRPETVDIYVGTTTLLKEIVGFNYHQGILAIAKIPPSVPLHELCAGSKPKLLVALDNLNNAENVGVIIRNCAACGVDACISASQSSDPYLRRSVRNSMGSIFDLPLYTSPNLAQDLSLLRSTYGFETIAADAAEENCSLHDMDFTKNSCIVFGNEHEGIQRDVEEVCSIKMKIPMDNSIMLDSFNVGCATAIILHEAFNQRSRTSGT